MEKFEEIKIKIVMKAENVSRDQAIEIIAARCRKASDADPVKQNGSIAAEEEFMSAEEFFGDCA